MDDVTKKIGEMNTAVEQLRSTTEENLKARDVVLETRATALESTINELRSEIDELTRNNVRPAVETSEEKRSAFAKELRTYAMTGVSTRAVTVQTGADQAAINAAGGFLVPEEFDKTIVTLAQKVSPLLADVDVQSTNTTDVKIHVDLGGAGSSWVSEVGTNGMYGETATPTFAEISPVFGALFAKPLISVFSLNDAYFDVEAFVNDRVAAKFGRDVGGSIVNGSGSAQPKGILAFPTAATADGTRPYGTIQYIATGQAAALPLANTYADKYLDMVAAMDPIYLAGAKWYFTREVANSVRKIKDANGNYMWQTSLVAGQPDMFLSFPVVITDDFAAVAANAFPGMLANLKEAYSVYDLVGTTMLRDPYSYDAYIALKTLKRFGGTVRNTEAIKLLKVAAS